MVIRPLLSIKLTMKRKQTKRVRNSRKKSNKSSRWNSTFEGTGEHVKLRSPSCSLVIAMPKVIAPKSTYVRLTWPESTLTRNNSTNSVMNWSYRMNSAFDPDPSFGTGAIPGFVEYANFYKLYRVHGARVRGTIQSLDNVPSTVVVTPVPTLSTNNTITVASALEYSENPYSIVRSMTGINGGPSEQRFDVTFSMTKVLGEKSWLFDPAYAATTAQNPASQLYIQFSSFTALLYTLGYSLNIHVEYDVEFYQRNRIFT